MTATWPAVRLKDVSTYINRGVAPTYVDGDTGFIAFSQKCVRGDRAIDPSLGRSMLDPGPSAASSALRSGDICVNSTGTGTLGRAGLISSVHLASNRLVADGHVTVVRMREDVANPRYVWYQLSTNSFYELANAALAVGSTNQTELGRSALGRAPLHLPPLAEQVRIVEFLDRETGRIDDLIEEQMNIVALLREYVVAYRFQLVLGPDGSGRPAWTPGRLKQFVTVTRGRFSHRPRNDPSLYDGKYPFIQTGDIASAAEGTITRWTQTLNEKGLQTSRLAPAGTLVMAIAANIGDVAWLGFDACFPDSVVALRPTAAVQPGFLLELIRALRSELVGSATLNTQLNTNIERIGEARVVIPPLDVQSQIARSVQVASERLATIEVELGCQIDLLREHRQALITAAVTAGLDAVRKVA